MGLFEESYTGLNAAQKQAVEYIDGPLLVVAGPGTGKTQLLSMRVANILQKTDTDPSAILCLTFTNKAALNMRERLLRLTDGAGLGVQVKTFHSFAAELMNMYPDYFWNGARLTTAPDVVQTEVIQEILARLPLKNPLALKFAGQFTAGRDVKNALKLAKEAGLTPEKLRALIQANLAYLDVIEPKLVDILGSPLSPKKLPDLQAKIHSLPEQGIGIALQPLQDLGLVMKESLDFAVLQDESTGKTTNTGKWKQRFVQSVDGEKGMFKERERNEWWLSLADVYEQYRDVLHKRGYYDYSDMIVEVITQIQNQPKLRADVQERYLYVMIDEFQDTNAAQLQLAHLIADHNTANGKPNLMVVGDDDQSIYKFNGAELSNMLSFQKSYPAAKLIILTDNYRSTQEILNTAQRIIEQAEDRLVLRDPSIQKNLQAKNNDIQPGEIVGQIFPSQDHELSGVARQIQNQYNEGSKSIAVLARGHASLRQLSAILLQLEVPVRYEQQTNILEHEAVEQVFIIANILLAIQQGNASLVNSLLSQTLRSPMWDIEPVTLWNLALKNYGGSNWLDAMLGSKDEHLELIANWLLWLSTQAGGQPLPVVFEYILGLRAGEHLTSPLSQYYARRNTVDTDYLHALSAIRLLRSMIEEFSSKNAASLEDFIRFIEVSKDSNEIIADETVFVSGNRAVELLTVHKAKGLEFDSVYIIDAIDSNWKPSAGGRKPPANLPLQPAGDDLDDYVRLLFVAATRAKSNLYIASYEQDSSGREVLTSPLITAAIECKQAMSSELVDPVVVLQENLQWPHLNSADEKRNLGPKLESFSLTATSLLDFLDVSKGGPDYFFERHLLSLPQTTSANMAFGNAVHAALELAQIQTNAGAANLTKILEHYQSVLADQHLPTNELKRYSQHGEELLTKLLKSDTFWLPKGALPEQAVNDVHVGQAQIKGKIDRIDSKENALIIVDYKTGKPLSSFTTRDQTKAIKAWRHRTQLVFYALLLQNSKRFKANEITGQMQYVEASTAKELVREYKPTSEEIDRLARIVEIVWKKVKDLNLPDITNYSSDYSGIQSFEQDLLDGKI